jgi:UDPglucose 6-dehydrogenase
MSPQKICIVGAGYVGGITGPCLAAQGHHVTCVDVMADKIAVWNSDKLPISEPGLNELVREHKGKNLFFSTDVKNAIEESDVIFACVGTPQKLDGPDAGSFDLRYLDSVARMIARFMNGYKVIIQKSTVPVGTVERITALIKANTPHPFTAVSNPEFLAEGTAVDDYSNPDRIVVGIPAGDTRASEIVRKVFHYVPDERYMQTTPNSAELIKLASNAMLATRISFINAMAALCDKTGADVTQVSKGMGLDSRIGPKFLRAGLGWGGSCFTKDLMALQTSLRESGLPLQADLLKTVLSINDYQGSAFMTNLKRLLFSLPEKTITLFGAAFKPNTDDIRDSRAIYLAKDLVKQGVRVRLCDPEALGNARRYLTKAGLADKIEFIEDPYEATKGAHAVLLITQWSQFGESVLDFSKIYEGMAKPAVLLDGRNFYTPKKMSSLGFKYTSIGRP